MEVKWSSHHHRFPDDHQAMKQRYNDIADTKKHPTFLFYIGQIQLFDFFNDDQIIPGQQEAVTRNIESWPGVSGLVASVSAQVLGEAADPGPLLDGGEEDHGEHIPDPGVNPQPQPGQQRRVLTQHLALTTERGWVTLRLRPTFLWKPLTWNQIWQTNCGQTYPRKNALNLHFFLWEKLF